ncbi:cell wall-binding repeat-containing protein [Ornithinimicrobium avium]|uniref:SGNH domain-containing protein n=1 Tax=Ornithinimicrobium avium TaxID=2283195 RepID=A0A345NN32_9MICO|nr:cell wall-binding repeat-containing protein [Ornithinimicrobium avium]AXH96440.1 hypothetical protein DV701_10190 [Ornithinimicrobium avium]
MSALIILGALPGTALTGDEDDLGARALHEDSWSTPVLGPDDLTRHGPVHPASPPADAVLGEQPSYYDDGCHVGTRGTDVLPGCLYGDPSSSVEVAMVGDSHIGRLFPALEEIAAREQWALRTYTKSACAFVDEPRGTAYQACDDYNAALRAHLANDPPDIVLTLAKRQKVADGYVRTWSWLQSIGVEHVVALWDSPQPAGLVPAECVADAISSGTDLTTCAMELPDADSGNPSMRTAAEQVPAARFLDLRDWVCPQSRLSPRCPAVLGRAQVYALGSHLATVFGDTLADPIHQRLHEMGVATYRPSVDRVGGADRYESAALLSRDVRPGGRVFVASGSDYPDALAAAARAGDGGAVLLTRRASLPAATRTALVRLQPSQILVVGGASAVDRSVLTDLQALGGEVRRVAGDDRYDTAAAVAGLAPAQHGGTVYVSSGAGFADALAAAAQAGRVDSPILLVRPGSVPEATARALDQLTPRQVVVVGGVAAVGDEVLDRVHALTGARTTRVGGADRYATAALLAGGTAARSELYVTSGTVFADALAAAPAAAAVDGAVLLVRPGSVPAPTSDAVRDLDPARIVLVGGPAAVTDTVQRTLIRLVR